MNVEDSIIYEILPKLAVDVYLEADIIWDISDRKVLEVFAYFPDKGFGFRCCLIGDIISKSYVTNNMKFVKTPADAIQYMRRSLTPVSFASFQKAFVKWIDKTNYVEGMIIGGDWEE